MINNVLKNKIAPWQVKGRWYKITVKSDGTTWEIIPEKSDHNLPYSIASNRHVIFFNDNKHRIIDHKADISKGTVNASFNAYSGITLVHENALDKITLPTPTTYSGEMTLLAFIKKH